MSDRGESTTYQIRPATLDDAVELQDYAVRLFAEAPPGIYERDAPTLDEERDFIRSHTEPNGSTMLVAVADGAIVGLLGFQARQLPQERHVGHFGISVSEAYRGAGIGTALIGALLAWAPSHGITRVEVEAFAANPDAIRLYERLGFEREGCRRDAVIVDGRPSDVIMMAHLLAT